MGTVATRQPSGTEMKPVIALLTCLLSASALPSKLNSVGHAAHHAEHHGHTTRTLLRAVLLTPTSSQWSSTTRSLQRARLLTPTLCLMSFPQLKSLSGPLLRPQ